jgi:trigger factor
MSRSLARIVKQSLAFACHIIWNDIMPMVKLMNYKRLVVIVILALFTFVACSTTDSTETIDDTDAIGTNTTETVDDTDAASTSDFSFSEGIDEDGFWKNVNALECVELCDYEGVSIPGDILEVTDEAIQTEIDTILANHATRKQITDRAVAYGDTVNIDYIGTIDGVEFEGGSTGGAGVDVTIGVTKYIDDFLEQLIGHTPGESFDIEVTFPEDYGKEDLNGKDATFAITINYIVETIVPELTDEFVLNKLSPDYGWSTVEEMQAGIKNELQNVITVSYLQEYVIDNTKILSLPEVLLEYQEESMLDYYQSYANSYGMNMEEFLSKYLGMASIEELIEANRTKLTQGASFALIVQAIAEDAGISVSDEDVAAYFKESGLDDYSEQKEYYGMPYLKWRTLNKAVLDYVKNRAVLQLT